MHKNWKACIWERLFSISDNLKNVVNTKTKQDRHVCVGLNKTVIFFTIFVTTAYIWYLSYALSENTELALLHRVIVSEGK